MSEHKDQPELTSLDYAVFETNGDDWCQLSVWTTKANAEEFLRHAKHDVSEMLILRRV